MYKEQTYDAIKNRILSNIDSDIDKREGSFTNDMISPLSVELAKTYIEFDNILNIIFAKNSYDNYLDLKCLEFGITRKKGMKANGLVTIRGLENTLIPKNTELSTQSGLIFLVLEEGQIRNGTVKVKVAGVEEGIKYNIYASEINMLMSGIAGIDSISNELDFKGGVDTETDEQLKERLLDKVRKPAISGNAQHYIEWASSIEGVEKVIIVPLWDGPGTVKVIVSSKDNEPVINSVIINCLEYINSVKPLGADITVSTTELFNVNISVNLSLDTDYNINDIRLIIINTLNEYFKECTKSIIYTKVGSLISNIPGVLDYSNLLVNSISENILVDHGDSIKLQNLTLNEGVVI